MHTRLVTKPHGEGRQEMGKGREERGEAEGGKGGQRGEREVSRGKECQHTKLLSRLVRKFSTTCIVFSFNLLPHSQTVNDTHVHLL